VSHHAFDNIFSNKIVEIERIVFDGHHTSDGKWYDQEKNEFVILLDGSAVLRFEDEFFEIERGDYILIEKHKKHRVESTDKKKKTVWLAFFF